MSLDEFFGPARLGRANKGCVVCGAESAVSVQVRIYDDKIAKRNKSRTHRFCAEHGIQKYEQAMTVLVEP